VLKQLRRCTLAVLRVRQPRFTTISRIVGTAFPLASGYWHGLRVRLDDVFVCHDKRRGPAKTLRVGFPDRMDEHLAHGDELGLCAGDAPL
jgi:hypothetical protein